VVVLSLCRPSRCQNSAASADQDSTIHIKKTTRLVEVQVIAKDKKGKPVTGLAAADFSLKDDGHAQKISFFSVQQPETAESHTSEENAPRSPNNAVSEFSNIHPGSASPIVILLDLLNTPADDQTAMRNALVASFKRSTSHSPTALLTLADSLSLISDFTTDVKSLAPLLEKPFVPRQEGIGPAITASKTANEKANETILKAAVQSFNWEAAGRADRTLSALNLIRRQFINMSGRKSLIWIGGGVKVGPQDWPAIKGLIEQFNDANVAIYTVDARGVLLDYGISADTDDQDMLGPWAEEQSESRGDILDVLARNTGGVPYKNTNALDVAITRAVEDSTSVYTLGYYPQHGDWQGKAHKIEVKVARGGVTLRYRTGYIATPEAVPTAADEQQRLQEIAASPIDFPGIRFTVEMKPTGIDGKAKFTLHMPADELRFNLREEKSIGAIQCWLIQRRPSGGDLASKTFSFSFQLTPLELESAKAQGISVNYPMALNPNADRIRVMVRDVNSGKVGTVDIPLTH
jgi:VWFA-related protein